ncbi:MAG TPA: 50S ribosomal protein L29 [Patescibacteria group bacterium]|nr:50S ribosomal protein L29 [Patescibacteria group bacterium]
MKRDQKNDLKKKSRKELNEQVVKKQKELVDLVMQQSIGKLKNVHELSVKKKEIAILKTYIREKELRSEK